MPNTGKRKINIKTTAMIQPAFNNIVVAITTKYIKNISSILKVAALENNSSVDPADLSQIVGTVVSIPKTITTHIRGYNGFTTKDIKVGDTAIFRFDVVCDFVELGAGLGRKFKNMFEYRGKEYWMCDIQKLFGIIRDGEIKMVNGYVMLADFTESAIVLPTHLKRKVRGTQSSEVLQIGSAKENLSHIGVKNGETVYFNPNLAAKYQINGKPFRIIQQEKILGKALNN